MRHRCHSQELRILFARLKAGRLQSLCRQRDACRCIPKRCNELRFLNELLGMIKRAKARQRICRMCQRQRWAAAAELPFERHNPQSSCLQFIASAKECGILTILTYSLQPPPKAFKLQPVSRRITRGKAKLQMSYTYSTFLLFVLASGCNWTLDQFPMYFVSFVSQASCANIITTHLPVNWKNAEFGSTFHAHHARCVVDFLIDFLITLHNVGPFHCLEFF